MRLCGKLKPVQAATNPGQFDEEAYYRSQQIGYTMWNPVIEVTDRPAISLCRMLSRVKEQVSASLKAAAADESGRILAAMVTGDKADLSDETRTVFRNGGISHVLVISGLHLGILGMGLYRLLRWLGLSTVPSGIAAVSFLYGYGILVGGGVSTGRALLMFAVRIGADLLGKTYDSPTALALTALLIAMENPACLAGSSFWLSFSAVLALMLFRGKHALAGGIFLSSFLSPILLYFFSEVSFAGILVNLVVIPTVAAVLLSGMAGGLAGLFSTRLASVLVIPGRYLLHIYEYLCKIAAEIPGMLWKPGKPNGLQLVLYYGILALTLFLYRKNRIYRKRFCTLLLMIPAWVILCFHGKTRLEITMLDVGQGDGIVIRTPENHTYLLDGGSSSEKNIGTYRILPFLKQAGTDHVEAVFLTHDDSDHMNGILEILESMERGKTTLTIGRIILPDWKDSTPFAKLKEQAARVGVPVYAMGAGDALQDGKTKITCLHPDGEEYRERENEGSLVLLLQYGEFDALFTGDLEGNAEKMVAERSPDIDLLKVAHHGSAFSSRNLFLARVRPELCLISCSENNRYGHPDPNTVSRLEQWGGTCFATKDCGAISVITDGEKIDLKTYCKYNDTCQT